MPEVLTIETFGTFSVRLGDVVISDTSPRSRKVWKIFKYLITNRHKIVTTGELIDMLWCDSDDLLDPLKSLYALVARLRKLLRKNTENDYILYRQNGYQWNPEAPVNLDSIRFEDLITAARKAQNDEEKMSSLKEAVALYSGGYLPDLASETWVHPVAYHHKQRYLWAISELAGLLERAYAWNDVISLYHTAIKHEPHNESLYERLIRALLINGETIEAKKQYKHIETLTRKVFGVQPSEELIALHRQIKAIRDDSPLDFHTIQLRLNTANMRRGAYFCATDTFSKLYDISLRLAEKSKTPVFLALVTVSLPDDTRKNDSSQNSAVRLLRQCLTRTLRDGEVVSQYSESQYIILLSVNSSKEAESILLRLRRMFAAESKGLQFELETHFSIAGHENIPLHEIPSLKFL